MSARPTVLVDFVTSPQWVAWRNEMRNGKITKVPYCSATRQAEADDASTWLPHDQAVLIADAIVNGSGGGIGIELGQCGEKWIVGVDLDTCRDPVSGIIEPWAVAVIERLNSYTEVSPSQTGVKAFFLIDPAEVLELRRIMGTDHGRQFKRANGSCHPPSIELYISNRYFTVTSEGIPDAPAELRVVPLADLRWLVEQAGPAFSGKAERKHDSTNGSAATGDTILGRLDFAAKHNKPLAAALLHAATMRGGSRSEGAFGLGAALRRAGWTYADMKAALLACPATREWAGEADERQFERIWVRGDEQDKREPQQEPPPDPATLGYWEDDFSDADNIPDPPRNWVVRDHLLRGTVTCLFGATGEGKSTTAILWGVLCALDQSRLPFGGVGKFKSPGGLRVSYYSLEEDQKEQRRRIRTTLIQFGAKFSDLGGRLISTGCDKVGTLICYDPSRGKLTTTDLMDALRRHITRHQPDVLFLDPMVELHTAPENDNSLLRLVTAMLRAIAREFNIAIVLMHHARKGDLTPGDIEALRGAGAIGGAIRFGFTVCPMSESDANQFGIQENRRSYYTRIDRAKASYAPPLNEADWFEKVSHLDQSGEYIGAFHPWEPPAVIGLSQEVISKLCTAIIKGSPDGQPWSPKLSGDLRSVHNLFAQHSIVGTKAEKAALQTLYAHKVETARFKTTASRNLSTGLRIGDLPHANWVEDDAA